MAVFIEDDEQFKTVFAEKNSKPVILFFTAEWCGPCKFIKPHAVEEANKLGVALLIVDVDKCEETSEQYAVNAMPTFMLIVDNQTKEQFAGASEKKVDALFQKALQ